MENATDYKLPFQEKPGALFIAPLGTPLPDHTVADGQFAMTWPAGWLRVLPGNDLTDPRSCSAREQVDTEDIRVSDFFDPVKQTTARTVRWDFGPEARASRVLRSAQGGVRMMVGWESEAMADRVIARQALVDEFGDVRLEEARKPTPPPVRLRWWQRLLRRRPKVIQPGYHPLYEVHTVGQLRKEVKP